VDEEREASTQKMEEEALRTRADHESQLEELTRRVRTLQGELLEARRVAAERAAAEREGAKEHAASTRVVRPRTLTLTLTGSVLKARMRRS